ncbi:MAG: hypothetical protein C0394_03775 [Syntrophus sp. (in: bacteria)]|nr:hypothetical protein [Syntrophus sp. (in: bacteria)]
MKEELNIHGARWNSAHDGYFSDPAIALPFLEAVSRRIADAKPDVVADLGGGTGFILTELSKRHAPSAVRYVNVDVSVSQLSECKDEKIRSLNCCVTQVRRDALVKDDRSVMLIMRSVLHYLGRDGAAPFLAHLRAQMKPGEMMIHQTACFESRQEAECANRLYALMRTPKWYPVVEALHRTLKATGWQVVDCQPAPGLRLKSPDLAERYALSAADLAQIRRELGSKNEVPEVFTTDGPDFTAFLHYRIFTCKAM